MFQEPTLGVDSHQARTQSDPSSPPPRLRAKATNRADFLAGLDGRSASARRYRDLVFQFIADQGGLDHCSEIKLNLLRRLASVVVQSELIEARMIGGEEVDVGTLCTLASTTVRLSSRLGLERVAKEVGPTLGEYLQQEEKRVHDALSFADGAMKERTVRSFKDDVEAAE